MAGRYYISTSSSGFVKPLSNAFVIHTNRYWEVVESYRRILFMSVLTVVDTPVRRGFVGAGLGLVGTFVYREVTPYQRSTTNLLNIAVQHQISSTFIYASLLLNHDGTGYTGVLAGIGEETAGVIMVIANLR